jgi:hypothetical protein
VRRLREDGVAAVPVARRPSWICQCSCHVTRWRADVACRRWLGGGRFGERAGRWKERFREREGGSGKEREGGRTVTGGRERERESGAAAGRENSRHSCLDRLLL